MCQCPTSGSFHFYPVSWKPLISEAFQSYFYGYFSEYSEIFFYKDIFGAVHSLFIFKYRKSTYSCLQNYKNNIIFTNEVYQIKTLLAIKILLTFTRDTSCLKIYISPNLPEKIIHISIFAVKSRV